MKKKNRFSGRNPDFLGLKKRVRLAIMLVMMTIFTSKIEELPPTSDMKIIGGNGWEVLKLSWNIISHQKDLLLSDTQNQVPLSAGKSDK